MINRPYYQIFQWYGHPVPFQYFASAIASRIGAQAEAERFFKKRGSKANLQLATIILNRAGTENPRSGDELPESN